MFHTNVFSTDQIYKPFKRTRKMKLTPKQKTTLENIFELIAVISIISFFFSLNLKAWMSDDDQCILNQTIYTSVLSFTISLVLYVFLCYNPENKDK